MTRLNILKNRRLLTFVLLGVTLLFGGLAVFLAIAINNRTVNPDNTNAASACDSICADADAQCSGASSCSSNSACQSDPTCKADCDAQKKDCSTNRARCNECQAQNAGKTLCRTEQNVANSGCNQPGENGQGSQQIWCDSCNPEGGCEVRNFTCYNGSSNPTPSGTQNYKTCNVYGDAAGCPAGQQKWKAVYALSCNGTSPVGDFRIVDVSACQPISDPQPTVAPTIEVTPATVDPSGWAYPNAKCRYPTGGGSCAVADFANGSGCNPGVGQMCVCRGNVIGKAGNYTYVDAVTTDSIGCLNSNYSSVDALCAAYGPGLHNGDGLKCGNTYRCPDAPPPSTTPTPQCTPKGFCDYSTATFVTTDCSGTNIISRTPDSSCTETCKKINGCDSSGNYVKYNCDGSVASSTPDSSCRETTNEPNAFCSALTANKTVFNPGEAVNLTALMAKDAAYPNFDYRIQLYNGSNLVYQNNPTTCTSATCTASGTYTLPANIGSTAYTAKVVAYDTGTSTVDNKISVSSCQVPLSVNQVYKVPIACYDMKVTRNGTALTDNATVSPGDVLSFDMSSTPGNIANRYAFSFDNSTYYIIKGDGVYNDQVNPKTLSFTVPAAAKPGSTIYFASASIYKIGKDSNNKSVVSTTCTNNDCANDNSTNIVSCGNTVNPFRRDPTATGPLGAIDPVTGATSTVQLRYSPAQKTAIENELAYTCSQSSACGKRFVISTTPPSACTNLTVTNTRTNQSCNGSNKAACANIGLRQGDTLTATVTGTGATGYSMSASYVTAANTTSTSSFNTQASSSFSITIPSTTEIKSANLIANTTNGVSTATSTTCNLPFTFASTPQVNKEINEANSVNLATGNVVTSASVVEYDLTINNTGTAIKNNVIVVDRLSAFDPANGGTAVNPPFGDMIQATDLTRTTGTKSTPSPVAPRAIFNASGTQIGAANPGNTYTTGQGVKTVEWNRITALHPAEAYTGKVRVDIGSFTNNPTLRNTVCLYNDTNNNGQYDSGTDTQIACDSVDVFTETPTFTVEKTSDVDTVGVGEPITYTITLTNTSGSGLDLSNLTVTDTIDPDKIDSLSITDISNGGTLANNVITWSSANLISANGGSTLAADGTIDLTFKATPDETIFSSASECSTQMINDVEADSTTPDYTTTGSTVTVTVTRVCITATPNPSGTLPPTGTDTPLYLPIIGVGLVAAAGTVFIFQKKILRRGGKNLQKTMSSETPEQKLRSKIRMRKK